VNYLLTRKLHEHSQAVALGQECPSYGDMTICRMGTLARRRVNSNDWVFAPPALAGIIPCRIKAH